MNEMENLTIRDVQRRVDDWIKTYGVRYFSELRLHHRTPAWVTDPDPVSK